MNAARLLSFALMSSLALAAPALAQDPVPAASADPVVEGQVPDLPPPPQAIPEIWAPAPTDEQGRSAYGLFLVGRLASGRGDATNGALYLRQALALTPEQPTVRDQAFAANLLSGDLAFAGRITPQGDDVPAMVSEAGRLVEVVQVLDRGDARAALAMIDARPIARPHQRAGRLLTPWLAAAAGDWDRALAPVAGNGPDSTVLFARADRARLLEMRRRHDEAAVEWQAVVRSPLGRRLFAADYGAFLERRNRRPEAVAFYDSVIAEGNLDDRLTPSRARAAARGRPPAVADLRRGAADALSAAAIQSTAERNHEFAAVYLRLSHDLAPSDLTLLNLGDALMAAGLEAPGREALGRITQSDPGLYASAQLSIGESFGRDGRMEDALEPLRRAVSAAPEAPAPAVALAGRLNALDRFAEALDALSGPAFADGLTDPVGLYAQAVALRGLQRDAEAEVALQAVLAVAPDDTAALTLLGALWLDAMRVEEGAALIARAAALTPEDAAVQGALGWSQYRQGLFDEAVATLEAAVGAQPADAVVNDHLGDAYWRVGRRREAQFQWSRALTLDPEPGLKAEVERKLANGLADPAPAGA